ncbi:MAG: nucleoside triphosphate pyrophosphohydrolase [Peptococcaceae bacterium]|nr:nucleoside triphosphate pyrophosphohydrolase [Peptococcaceae bacterium]
MKSVLHIVGLGYNSLEKLSLESYRRLQGADTIYILNAGHKVAQEMIAEGLPCHELGLTEDAAGQEIAGAILTQIQSRPVKSMLHSALALPGYPLAEGKTISALREELCSYFLIDTSLLAEKNSLQRLVAIMAELRSPEGCPWDKEQNHQTLKKYLIEETYEVIDAIDGKDMNNFCEELGDLLLQIVFHSRIAEELGNFELEDVIQGICDKMIRRHPHVFGSGQARTSEEVLVNWDKIKRHEKASAPLETVTQNNFDIPKGLPALLMAEATQKKAAQMGFDWDNYRGPLAKVYEELRELEKEIGNRSSLEEELGDLLFSIVNLSRFLNLNAEEALRQGVKKFQWRFNQMLSLIEQEGLNSADLSLQEMDYYWNLVKKQKNSGRMVHFTKLEKEY